MRTAEGRGFTPELSAKADRRGVWTGPLRVGYSMIIPIVAVCIWEALAQFGLINQVTLPAPSKILRAAINTASSGELFLNIGASLVRILAANVVSAAAAVPLGFAMGLSRRFEQLLDGFVNILRPIPPLAWIPLAILWFGLGEVAVIYITSISAFFAILLNTIAGVRDVDRSLVRAAQSLGATRAVVVTQIILPASLPSIFTGFRIALGVSWMSIVAAELIASSDGLGYMINYYRELLRPDLIIVGMLTIGFIGFGMDRLLVLIERRLLPWKKRD